jgi:segregation and condensation protein A
MSYKIRLDLFEGPLDLLLYLVKKDHINVYDIPIAQITEQYIRYLEVMKFLDLNIAGEFLVMAATLLQIKSKMLLPVDENNQPEPEDQDPRDELVKQLLEYEKYKEVAEKLRQREAEQRELFKRPKTNGDIPSPLESEGYFEASIFDLINAFSQALKEAPKELFYKVIKDEFTVEEKVHDLLHLFLVNPRVTLSELFQKTKDKMEVIVTLLAILELIRLKEIVVWQKGLFGEIVIARNEENIAAASVRFTGEPPGSQPA